MPEPEDAEPSESVDDVDDGETGRALDHLTGQLDFVAARLAELDAAAAAAARDSG